MPGWLSEYPEETAALDRYVFGDLKSRETNLIPDLATALKLLNDFSSSPREFEIILCCAGPSDGALAALKSEETAALGYDVAVAKGDGWSIVGDFASGEWANVFLKGLNEFGLFRERPNAEDYLRGYRGHNEPDADMPFEVVYVG